MRKVAIRPGVWMAYEDHWFGEPWTHARDRGDDPRQFGILAGLDLLGSASRAALPRHPAGSAGLRRSRPSRRTTAGARAELAADIGRFLDALEIETCHLIGAKYGGSACMRFAIDQPHRLRSLCLFGSPVRGSGSGNADLIRAKGVRQWAADTMRARLGSAASEAQVKWWTEELMGKTPARAAYSASASRIDMELENELPRITAPTLIVTTQESGLQSVEAVERYARRIPVSRGDRAAGRQLSHRGGASRTFARGMRWSSCSRPDAMRARAAE